MQVRREGVPYLYHSKSGQSLLGSAIQKCSLPPCLKGTRNNPLLSGLHTQVPLKGQYLCVCVESSCKHTKHRRPLPEGHETLAETKQSKTQETSTKNAPQAPKPTWPASGAGSSRVGSCPLNRLCCGLHTNKGVHFWLCACHLAQGRHGGSQATPQRPQCRPHVWVSMRVRRHCRSPLMLPFFLLGQHRGSQAAVCCRFCTKSDAVVSYQVGP